MKLGVNQEFFNAAGADELADEAGNGPDGEGDDLAQEEGEQ